ncbi:unnamed protein product [Mycena citricolor]|uniref:Uncharacterized protein n=1 Tax=Mycena citricolor TaxID=2018698 RepID=A0AAD2H1B7_9AGAR|nr:unnamed protein product [Mycena citricolor]
MYRSGTRALRVCEGLGTRSQSSLEESTNRIGLKNHFSVKRCLSAIALNDGLCRNVFKTNIRI